MDSNLAQAKIKTALKQALKKNNHKYSDVAKVWKCSLPTVKRQLGNEELPVSRLLELLDWLNLSLSELQALADSDSLSKAKFTPKQIEFLAKNLREFAFLNKLYEEMSPQQIAKKYKIETSTLDKILRQLEKYDLIRVGAGGQIRPFYSKMPSLQGSLALATIRRQIDCMAQYSKVKIEETIALKERGVQLPPGEYSWIGADVSEKSYREFLKRFGQLLEDFSTQAKLDERTLKKAEIKKAVISFSAQLEEPESPHLELVTEIFSGALKSRADGT